MIFETIALSVIALLLFLLLLTRKTDRRNSCWAFSLRRPLLRLCFNSS